MPYPCIKTFSTKPFSEMLTIAVLNNPSYTPFHLKAMKLPQERAGGINKSKGQG